MLKLICVMFFVSFVVSEKCFNVKKTLVSLQTFLTAYYKQNANSLNFLKDIFNVPIKALMNSGNTVRSVLGIPLQMNRNDFADVKIPGTNVSKLRSATERRPLAQEIIQADKYSIETHTVHTKDGYHLMLHRIPNKTQNSRVVLLHHGLFGSADDWLILGPKKSLPYMLADLGYDVWFANARGNRYSRLHTTYKVTSPEFWNFSAHEIGYFDLQVTFDHIKQRSPGRQIGYVGYCLGATVLLILLATFPQYNSVVKFAIFLAPLYTMYTARGLMKLLAEYSDHRIDELMIFLGKYEVRPSHRMPKQFLNMYCPGDKELCSDTRIILASGGEGTFDDEMLKKVILHPFSGASSKTILHFCQMIKHGVFQMFDYGEEKNKQLYGTKEPIRYNLHNVDVPIILLTSPHDRLATTDDVLSLMLQLPGITKHFIIKRKNFSHLDFLWSKEAPVTVFSYITDALSGKNNSVLGKQ